MQTLIESVLKGLHYALRQLRRSPGFAVTVVLTLALGVGPLTAVFAVFQQVMLKQLSLPDPRELVLLEEHSAYETGHSSTYGGSTDLYFTYPAYVALRDQAGNTRVLHGLAAAGMFSAKIVTDQDTDQTQGQIVSGNYFHLLGVQAVLGRVLRPEDDRPGDPSPVAVLTNSQDADGLTVAGYVPHGKELSPDQNWIIPDFFSTLGIPLLRGRSFNDSDNPGTQFVAIVDQAFVQHYYGGDSAKALAGHFGFGDARPDVAIVGIVPTVHVQSLSSMPRVPFVYLPFAQTYTMAGLPAHRSYAANFYVRTSGDPAKLAADVHALVHRVDRTLPVTDLTTMQDQFEHDFGDTRAMTVLTLLMGALALVLAGVGMYGVLAFLVATRRRESGVRIAVGAGRRQVVALVLRQVARLAGTGIVGGAALTWIIMRLSASRMAALNLGPSWLYALPPLAVTVVAIAAALAPARQATLVDPAEVLRAE
jgi:hypothetical protein